MPLQDYGALIRSGMAIVPDYAAEEAKRQLLSLQRRQIEAEIAKTENEQRQQDAFQGDLHDVLLNPTADNYSKLILRHPRFKDQVKAAWDMSDTAKQRADLTQMGEVYSAASNGRYDLAAASLKRRIEADKAADGTADPQDESILAALESGDPVQQKAALGTIGLHLAAVTGPDKFAATLGAVTDENKDFTLGPGGRRYNANGELIAEAPFAPRPLTVNDGDTVYEYQPGAGGSPAPPTAGFSPHATDVATTLAGAGIPKHVVAGFLGNFHIEGGYNGEQGDGGVASGIAQWHPDRQANFERVIGKPVSQASPIEQARFVAWEMQNPQAAGMTVAQRDAILNSKDAAQAAALIDQYYERSSGEHRSQRMAAAQSYFSTPASNGPVKVRSKQEYDRLATGTQYVAPDGSVRVKS